MKTVVSLQELVEFEIRPGRLVEEFRALTREAVSTLAAGPVEVVSCPGCGAHEAPAAFTTFGLTYRECATCGSLYVSPRPGAAALAAYAETSPAARFWRERILGETLETRREKLVRPRAEWVVDALAEHRPKATHGADAQSANGPFAEEVAAAAPALSPLQRFDPAHAWTGAPLDFVTAFDVLDRAADVRGLVARAQAALAPGGLLFVTAPCISGFDLQVLWDRSTTLLPPDKLNVLSLEGFRRLFAAPAWDVIELSTPGMFDVENVRHAIQANPDANWPRGVRDLVMQDESGRRELQEYLQRHRLASFARLVVRRSAEPSE